ncbi:MAG: hypothetical protein ACOY94_02800 [Bacillota bacterium]
MTEPLVLAGCPVRNRAWILPAYLAALEALDYPPERLCFAFIINDSVDQTESILTEFATRRPTRLVRRDLGHPRWERGYYSCKNLALLRNLLLEEALAAGADYLFSVDSDILVPPHSLRRLLRAGKPVVGARVGNDPGAAPGGRCNFLRFDPGRKRMVHLTRFPPDALIPVDVVGAAALIHRPVIEAGCRYEPAFTGEDEGFCAQVAARGFTLWGDTGLQTIHRMDPVG